MFIDDINLEEIKGEIYEEKKEYLKNRIKNVLKEVEKTKLILVGWEKELNVLLETKIEDVVVPEEAEHCYTTYGGADSSMWVGK